MPGVLDVHCYNIVIKCHCFLFLDVEVLVSSEVKHPDGVAVDWVPRNL